MGTLTTALLRFRLALALALTSRRSGRAPRSRDDRGDVPGWVLVTLMSVTLVIAIGALAQDQLVQMLRASLNSVK